MQGSEGAAFVETLDVDQIDTQILKGQERLIESYSAFKDPWGLCPSTLDNILKEAGIKNLFVVGLGIQPQMDLTYFQRRITASKAVRLMGRNMDIAQLSLEIAPRVWLRNPPRRQERN